MSASEAAVSKAVAFLESKISFKPRLGIICGSGLGGLIDIVENKVIIKYASIPGFPQTTGMSTVPEVLTARHCNMDVVAIALVTDMCVMLGDNREPLTHDQVLATVQRCAEEMKRLVSEFVKQL